MKLLSGNYWRSRTNQLTVKLLYFGLWQAKAERLENFFQSMIKAKWGRFSLGSLVGVSIAALYWSYSVYFQIQIPLGLGIFGSSILTICCGVAAINKNLDRFIEDLLL